MTTRVANIRTERTIAHTRVVLVALTLLLVRADVVFPEQPLLGSVLLGVYLLCAMSFALLLGSLSTIQRWWPAATHVVDLLVCLALIDLTAGASRPFFVYYVFLLTAATLRWQSRGVVATGAATLLSTPLLAIVRGADIEPPVFLGRVVLIAVTTWLLAYLGVVQERRTQQLEALARWPTTIPTERPALARDVLEPAARILPAPRLLLVWEEREEPWLDVASWDAGRFSWRQEPPGSLDGLVIPALQHCSFLCYRASDPAADVLCLEDGTVRRVTGSPLAPSLRQRYNVEVVASWPVRSGDVDGRLFCFDGDDMSIDDVVLGESLAALVATRLAHAELLQEVRQSATVEDRVSLARDLHDGVLQALTGAALQLQAARRLLASDTRAAAARLDELQQILAAEHAEIRSFIDDLKPPPDAARGEVGLAGQLGVLASRVRRQWGVEVQLAIEPDPLLVPDTIAPDIYFLVHEAVVNAARHAAPTQISVAVLQSRDRLAIGVADDGHGFPFEGQRSGDELASLGMGPSSLRERVKGLGGQLTIDSGAAGTRVEIDLPIAARES